MAPHYVRGNANTFREEKHKAYRIETISSEDYLYRRFANIITFVSSLFKAN